MSKTVITARRSTILNLVRDSVASLFYYDRKECEEVPIGEIENSINLSEVTIEEIVSVFRQEVQKVVDASQNT